MLYHAAKLHTAVQDRPAMAAPRPIAPGRDRATEQPHPTAPQNIYDTIY